MIKFEMSWKGSAARRLRVCLTILKIDFKLKRLFRVQFDFCFLLYR